MATAPKKKAAPAAAPAEAPATKKKLKVAPPPAEVDEEDEAEEEAPPPPKKKAKAKVAAAPPPEEEDEDEDAEEGDEDEAEAEDGEGDDAEEGEEGEEGEDEAPASAFESIREVLADAFPKQRKGEADGDYISKLVLKVNDLSDEDYANLNEAADDWFKKACRATEKKRAIPALPGFKDEEAAPAKPAKAADAPKEERGAALKRWREEQARMKANGELPPAKPKKEKGPKKERGTGVSFAIRLEVAADPAADLETLRARLLAKGFTVQGAGTLGTTRASVLATIRAMKQIGWLPPKASAKPAPVEDDEEEDEAPAAPPPKKKAKASRAAA